MTRNSFLFLTGVLPREEIDRVVNENAHDEHRQLLHHHHNDVNVVHKHHHLHHHIDRKNGKMLSSLDIIIVFFSKNAFGIGNRSFNLRTEIFDTFSQ